MITFNSLSQLQLDVLKEVGNIGAGHATTALSQLISETIKMTVPAVSVIPLSQVGDLLGGAENLVASIYMRVYGDAPGKILLFITYADALLLVDKVAGTKCGFHQTFGDYEISALKEIGNIMTGAYLYALGRLTGFNFLPSVPAFACDMAGAILNTAFLDLGLIGDYAMLIETQFMLTQRRINGHFFLVPDPGALDNTLAALGVGPS